MARFFASLILLTAAANVALANAGVEESTTYLVVLFLHQILFVFWLGPDIGIYMWSLKATNPAITPAQRVSAGRIMRVIDIIPKVCMSLMLTVGGILTEMKGIEHPWWQMAGIWLLGPVWLTMTLLVYLRAGTEAGAQLARLDILFRWLVVVSVIGSVGLSLSTGRLSDVPWITGKLLLFAAVVFFSILGRQRMQPFVAGIDRLEKEGPSESVDQQLAAAMGRGRLYMMASWLALAAAALLGVVQPG